MTVFSFTAKAAQIVYTSPREANPMVIVDGQKADDDALNKIDSDAIESITILKEEAAKASYAHLGDTSDGVIVVETKKEAVSTSSLKPLVIIDGKEYDSMPDDIDSDTIESITVLKDEKAKELYGERVKDGVIIIKLKENASPATGGSTTDGIKIVGTATTQKTDQPAASYGQAAVLVAQKMPQFEGGDLMTFRQWVMNRIRFPKEALENDLFGRVVASFVIDTEGNLGDIKVLASPDEILSKEACRVLEKSPKWTPGEENGKVVNVKFTLPIDFNIQTNDALLKEDAPAAKTIEPIAVIGFK